VEGRREGDYLNRHLKGIKQCPEYIGNKKKNPVSYGYDTTVDPKHPLQGCWP
jgi:hypothetical protein